jgi:hypothetical protein
MVPPFALFEFIVAEFTNCFRTNNAKSGTCGVDAGARASLVAIEA